MNSTQFDLAMMDMLMRICAHAGACARAAAL
jgi:hypothetical protein